MIVLTSGDYEMLNLVKSDRSVRSATVYAVNEL